MRNNNLSLSYEKRIVAFIDILGFKSIIRESETNPEKLHTIDRVLRFLKGHENNSLWGIDLMEIEEDAQYKGMNNFNIQKDVACTCFSDSIVVSVRVDDVRVNEVVSTLVSRLAQIGGELMSDGILIRGGLTIGNLIHSHDGVIMGQGLIDAYELESKVSKHARIVLSDKLLGLLNYPLMAKKDRYPYHQYFMRFSDGCVGFHQMMIFQVIQSADIDAAALIADKLDQIRKVIVSGLDSSFQQPEIFQKFQWLMEQYNGLYILGDKLRLDIMPLNHQIPGHNVHFGYTDDFYARQRDRKREGGE